MDLIGYKQIFKDINRFYINKDGDVISVIDNQVTHLKTFDKYNNKYCRLKYNGKSYTISIYKKIRELFNIKDTFENDEFVDVVGYEGLYKINKKGEIINLGKDYCYRGIRKVSKRITGEYYTVSLIKDKIKKTCFVHKLLAEAFIPNPCPDKYNQVNHKDENKLNNDLNNLEWCDNKYNIQYSCGTKIYIEDIIDNTKKLYNSITDLSYNEHISTATIYKYLRNNNLYKNRYKIYIK